ncbi:hypothetical protein BH11PLA2_BH11PLA2_48090 [soil metagenome]
MIGLLAAFDITAYEVYLPYVVGGGVMLVMGLIFSLTRTKKRGLAHPPVLKINSDSTEQDGDDTFANRRSASRREGQPVQVLMSSPTFRGQFETGWVLDRSTGGVRLAVADPIAVGSTIQIRTENAPDTIPWVTIIVRSCKPDEKHHELGCSFEATPPWNVLLLFG